MKFVLPLAAAASFALAVPAFADEPREQAAEQSAETEAMPAEEAMPEEEAQPQEAPAAIEVPAIEAPREEKRICRRIRTDMSSRRASRVCMTRDEWREFNQRR